MATRYWVGGSGTWDGTSTANWSSTSGGASGASAPTSADNVIFNANSNVGTGSFTVTVASGNACADITVSGLDGAMTLSGSDLSVYGSVSLPATNFTWSAAGLYLQATTTGKTLNFNGVSINHLVIVGIGGGWTLNSALTTTDTTYGIIHEAGTFNTNGYAVTTDNYDGGTSLGSARTLTLGASTFTVADGFDASDSDLTVSAGTSTIVVNGGNGTFFNHAYYNISYPSGTTTSPSFTSGSSANNFTLVGNGTNNVITIDVPYTVSGTLTVTGSSLSSRYSLSFTSTTTITAASVVLENVDFRRVTAAGAASPFTGVNLGNLGGNSNITFPSGRTVYWNKPTGGNIYDTAWATSSGGTASASNFPLPQDTIVIENTGLNTSASIDFQSIKYGVSAMNASGRSTAATFIDIDLLVLGNFSLSSSITLSGSTDVNLSGIGVSTTLTTAGKTVSTVTIDGALVTTSGALTTSSTISTVRSGTLTLGGTLTSGGTISIGSGSFSTANNTVSTTTFSASSGTTITLGSSSITVSGSGSSAWSFNSGATLVTNTATISLSSASAKTFAGGGKTYYNVRQTGTGTLTISGNNTFNNLTNTVQPCTVTITAGSTQTFASFGLSGNSGSLVTIQSSSTTAYTFVKSGGGVVQANYISISRSTASPTATWYAANSTNGGNNTNWTFGLAPTYNGGGNFMAFF